MTTPSPSTPPPLPPAKRSGPPPLPIRPPESLAHFVPPPPAGWAVVGTFSASEWHTARVLLTRRNIIARMGNAVDETGHTIEMLVPAGNAAYARSLLADPVHSVVGVDARPGGFPVSMADKPQGIQEVPFANPVGPGLTPREVLPYNILLAFSWLALIVILIVLVLSFLLP